MVTRPNGAKTISISLILLHIAAAVCLLLWGTRLVKNGFTRAYGTSLRRVIAMGTKNRFLAFGSGMIVTAMLQSSTAATLLMLSFMKRHKITLSAALAVVIGADITTTLVAQILTFDLSWLSPALLIIGIIGRLSFEHSGRKRHLFNVVIGLGLMLLALTLIREAAAPLAHSPTLPLILTPLQNDPVLAILVAATLTWAMHSSLAAVLLFISLAASNIINLELGLLLILGANLGGAFVPFLLTLKDGQTARRITIGNILMRVTILLGCLITLPFIIDFITSLDDSTPRQLVHFHTAFNVGLGLVFLPLTGLLANTLKKMLPAPKNVKPKEHDPLYLDEKALETPVIALASAARETLRMADMVQSMLENTIEAFKQNEDTLAKTIRKKDDTVDRLYAHIKLYLARLTGQSLDPKESDRYLQIMTFATNLEHIGDIIDKSLMDLATRKIKHKERFSEEGWKEIKSFHKSVVENMIMAQTIFLSEDPELAQGLIDQKKTISAAAKESSALHFDRLRSGLPETIATSALHLDIIRDYRRINSYITSVAYTILENADKFKDMRKSH